MNYIYCILFIFFINPSLSQSRHTMAFASGEKLKYVVSYFWHINFGNFGEIKFDVRDTIYNHQNALYLQAIGKTFSIWDWFFKVYDRYISIVNPETHLPYYYLRNVFEGGFTIYVNYIFDWQKQCVYSVSQSSAHPLTQDTIKILPQTFDLISMIYYIRNLDYEQYKTNDTIKITVLLDNKLQDFFVIYKAIDTLNLKIQGKFQTYKLYVYFKHKVLEKDNKKIKVWLSRDKNRIPLFFETPIIIGSIHAKIIDLNGIKHKISSLIQE